MHNNMVISADDGDSGESAVDVGDDSVAMIGVKPAENRQSSYCDGLLRSASSPFKHVSRVLRRLASILRRRGPAPSPGPANIVRSKSAAEPALQGLKFISKPKKDADGRTAAENRFDELAENGVLHRSNFGKCIGMKELDFAGELFDALARQRNIAGDTISKAELRKFLDQISDNSFESRLQTFFDMVDKDADGRITEKEVKEIITLSASANMLSKVKEQAEGYARLIMEELDPDNVGFIELAALESVLRQLLPSRSTSTGTTNSKMASQKQGPTTAELLRRWYRRATYSLGKNWRSAWVLLLWLSICAALFAWKFLQYRRRSAFEVMGYCVCVAKGGAETLKFNMALILLPVCRNTVTWVRSLPAVARAMPFDGSLGFHKMIAAGVAAGAGLHVVSHLACDFPRLLHATAAQYAPMAPFFGEAKPASYWWFVRGTEGWTGLAMLALMAVAFMLATPWFRRTSFAQDKTPPAPQRFKLLQELLKPLTKHAGFNSFWYSHHLFVAVYALLIVHGHFLYLNHKWYKKTTWMYIAVPMVLYACERLTRALRSRVWPVKILKAAVYPGDVLCLHFSKPDGFTYKSGQYIFVKCAAVSPFQWHPFSITSAPQDDYVSVHIRSAGDWTGDLNKVFSEPKSGVLRPQYTIANPSYPKVRIDGPYGAPAQDYKQYDVVLLVGLGIGATPMFSILKDIISNVKKRRDGDLETGHIADDGGFRTRRAYFYWSTREQGSFEWFSRVMDEVKETDADGVIELHNHCTSVYQDGDARSALITMLQSLRLAKDGVDPVSGTHVRAHFGRPCWSEVYKRIAHNHKYERVGVFYCGAPVLTKELRELAQQFSEETSTTFEFHKENF